MLATPTAILEHTISEPAFKFDAEAVGNASTRESKI
jgi:hypothetical protein